MNAIIKGILTLPVAAALAGCCNSNVGTQPAQEETAEYVTEKAYDVPAFEKGYEHGVSAMYTATTDDALYIAGGCNFPDVPAAEGGNKIGDAGASYIPSAGITKASTALPPMLKANGR